MRFTAIGAGAGWLLAAACPAGAGVMHLWEFHVHVVSGPLEGSTYSGEFGFTMSAAGAGAPTSIPLDFLDFLFDTRMFSEQDDINYPAFPRAHFDSGGNLMGIDYFVRYVRGDEETEAGIRVFNHLFLYDLDVNDPSGSGQGAGSVVYIPSPGAWMLIGAGALPVGRRRRAPVAHGPYPVGF